MPKLFSCLKLAIAVLFTGMLSAQVQAQPTGFDEHAQLTILVRQLEMLDRMVNENQMLSQQHSRYHFDYQRLHHDMQRIRDGIRDYLSPQRAQPRDPVEITGHYTIERINSGKGQP